MRPWNNRFGSPLAHSVPYFGAIPFLHDTFSVITAFMFTWEGIKRILGKKEHIFCFIMSKITLLTLILRDIKKNVGCRVNLNTKSHVTCQGKWRSLSRSTYLIMHGKWLWTKRNKSLIFCDMWCLHKEIRFSDLCVILLETS